MNFDFLCLTVGLAVGFAAGWLSYRGRQSIRRELAEEDRRALEKESNDVRIELAKASERNNLLEENSRALQSELGQERQFNISLHAELSRERTSRNHLEQKLELQKTDLLQLQQRLSEEFKHLVQQVLEEKSQSLNDLNNSSMNSILQPISEKLQDFKQTIEDQHSRETHELIVLHNKLSNIESKHLSTANGTPTPPTPSPAEPAPSPKENDSLTENGFVELTPELLKSSFFGDENSILESDFGSPAPPEPDDPQSFSDSFSDKQQVEIDNFFKRTLGRVQKK